MRRELISLAMTASILLSLLAFAQPTAAVLTTVSGPDEVEKPDPIVFDATVEIREDERIPIESLNLVIATDEGETATVTFARDGTVQSLTPSSGVVGQGEIHINQLRRSLEITPVDPNADFGYGYRSGTNERTGEDRSFGYGYGYGYGDAQPSLSYRVSLDSRAFKHGEYTVQLSINTDDDGAAFASNEHVFEVVPGSTDATVEVHPETLDKAGGGNRITAYIELPDRDASTIDIGSVELNGVPAVEESRYGFVKDPELMDRDNDGLLELMVKFPRDAVADSLGTGEAVVLTITGSVGDATVSAEDTIRVIENGVGSHDSNAGADESGAEAADDHAGDRRHQD